MQEVETVSDTLDQRGKTHGEFKKNAEISQRLKRVMEASGNWGMASFSDVYREALHMFAAKICRILNGNPDEPDHWHDIAGYASLAEREARGRNGRD